MKRFQKSIILSGVEVFGYVDSLSDLRICSEPFAKEIEGRRAFFKQSRLRSIGGLCISSKAFDATAIIN